MGLTSKNLLVIGGSGFIGKSLSSIALNEGFNVTTLSKNKHSFKNNITQLSADISNFNSLKNALKGLNFDFIVNLAGYIDHSSERDAAKKVFDTHFNGVRNLTKYFKNSNIKTFIQIGSSDEYGSNSCPQIEDQREDPFSSYSLAKVNSTHYLQTIHKTDSFPSIVLRPFLVYGPGQNKDRLIPFVIDKCLKNETFNVSEGNQLRDFCYVDDVSRAIINAINNKNAFGEIINLASGTPVSIREIIEKIRLIINAGVPNYGAIPYRYGENMCLYGDTSKSKLILNWDPKISLDQGLRQTIEWYKNS